MDTFAPEFAHYWLASQAGSDDRKPDRPDDDGSSAQQQALEALADRVSAARSII